MPVSKERTVPITSWANAELEVSERLRRSEREFPVPKIPELARERSRSAPETAAPRSPARETSTSTSGGARERSPDHLLTKRRGNPFGFGFAIDVHALLDKLPKPGRRAPPSPARRPASENDATSSENSHSSPSPAKENALVAAGLATPPPTKTPDADAMLASSPDADAMLASSPAPTWTPKHLDSANKLNAELHAKLVREQEKAREAIKNLKREHDARLNKERGERKEEVRRMNEQHEARAKKREEEASREREKREDERERARERDADDLKRLNERLEEKATRLGEEMRRLCDEHEARLKKHDDERKAERENVRRLKAEHDAARKADKAVAEGKYAEYEKAVALGKLEMEDLARQLEKDRRELRTERGEFKIRVRRFQEDHDLMESELDETQTNAQMMLREAQAEIIALKNTAQRIEAEWEVTKLEQAAVAAEKEKERARQKVELRFKTVWMSALRASFVRWKSESRRIKNGRAIEEERKLLISNAAKAEKALEEESARGAAMLEAAREEAKREREAAKLQREETLAAAKKDLNDAEAAKKAAIKKMEDALKAQTEATIRAQNQLEEAELNQAAAARAASVAALGRLEQRAALRFRTVLMSLLRSSFTRWKNETSLSRVERVERAEMLEHKAAKERAEQALEDARASQEKMIEGMKAKHEESVDAIKTEHSRAVETIKAEHSEAVSKLEDALRKSNEEILTAKKHLEEAKLAQNAAAKKVEVAARERAAQTATLRFRTVLMGSLRSSFVRWKYVAKYQKMERTEQSERLALVKEKEKAENELAEARKANQETVAAMRSKQAETLQIIEDAKQSIAKQVQEKQDSTIKKLEEALEKQTNATLRAQKQFDDAELARAAAVQAAKIAATERALQKAALRFKTVMMGSLRASFQRWKYAAKFMRRDREADAERETLLASTRKAGRELEDARRAQEDAVASLREKQRKEKQRLEEQHAAAAEQKASTYAEQLAAIKREAAAALASAREEELDSTADIERRVKTAVDQTKLELGSSVDQLRAQLASLEIKLTASRKSFEMASHRNATLEDEVDAANRKADEAQKAYQGARAAAAFMEADADEMKQVLDQVNEAHALALEDERRKLARAEAMNLAGDEEMRKEINRLHSELEEQKLLVAAASKATKDAMAAAAAKAAEAANAESEAARARESMLLSDAASSAEMAKTNAAMSDRESLAKECEQLRLELAAARQAAALVANSPASEERKRTSARKASPSPAPAGSASSSKKKSARQRGTITVDEHEEAIALLRGEIQVLVSRLGDVGKNDEVTDEDVARARSKAAKDLDLAIQLTEDWEEEPRTPRGANDDDGSESGSESDDDHVETVVKLNNRCKTLVVKGKAALARIVALEVELASAVNEKESATAWALACTRRAKGAEEAAMFAKDEARDLKLRTRDIRLGKRSTEAGDVDPIAAKAAIERLEVELSEARDAAAASATTIAEIARERDVLKRELVGYERRKKAGGDFDELISGSNVIERLGMTPVKAKEEPEPEQEEEEEGFFAWLTTPSRQPDVEEKAKKKEEDDEPGFFGTLFGLTPSKDAAGEGGARPAASEKSDSSASRSDAFATAAPRFRSGASVTSGDDAATRNLANTPPSIPKLDLSRVSRSPGEERDRGGREGARSDADADAESDAESDAASGDARRVAGEASESDARSRSGPGGFWKRVAGDDADFSDSDSVESVSGQL